MTDKEMEEKYGKNWDCRPHSKECECESCTAWVQDYEGWKSP